MPLLLLDADVAIDLLRNHPLAVEWEASIADDTELGMVGYNAMELLDGSRSKLAMKRFQSYVEMFALYWPNEADRYRAIDTFSTAKLSHNIGIIDTLVAECVIGLDATLCTFNTKHFNGVPGLSTLQPYEH